MLNKFSDLLYEILFFRGENYLNEKDFLLVSDRFLRLDFTPNRAHDILMDYIFFLNVNENAVCT